jgi:hypothetical protein
MYNTIPDKMANIDQYPERMKLKLKSLTLIEPYRIRKPLVCIMATELL